MVLRVIIGVLCCFVVSYFVGLIHWRARSHGHRLPPGPTGLPFVGHILHMRRPALWEALDELCRTYGDVVHLSIFSKHIVVLGSPQAIVDLLDHQSAVTSDRQQSPVLELSGQSFNFAMFPYGHRWRRHRRVFSQHIPSTVPQEQLLLQEKYASLFLRKLLADPADFCNHIRHVFSATIIKLAYGVEVAATDDPIIGLMVQTVKGLQGFAPGQFLVHYLPILRFVPLWVPLLGPQLRELARCRAAADKVKQVTFDKTRDDLTKGHKNTSVLATILQEVEEQTGADVADEHLVAKDVCVTAFEGAAETTFATVQAFFLAISLNPDVQKKAQAELEFVVGPHRLPTHEDRSSLPYVNAVLKETLRWHTVLPLGASHVTQQDITYRGYIIPKGSTLIANAWACMHDPNVYSDPNRYLPERFIRDGKLNPAVRDPGDFVFGYGRRICPGQAFAEAQMFDIIAKVLHVFDITPPLDEAGNPIRIEPRMTGSSLLYPADCRCTIKPRSAQAEALIQGTAVESTDGLVA